MHDWFRAQKHQPALALDLQDGVPGFKWSNAASSILLRDTSNWGLFSRWVHFPLWFGVPARFQIAPPCGKASSG
jgi:hypothetical protein